MYVFPSFIHRLSCSPNERSLCHLKTTNAQPQWAKKDLVLIREKEGPDARLPPEKRLYFAMFGAPAIPISLFWMGWTNDASISYWSGLIASILFGYGILCIFISTYQYIIDSYEMYAASALVSLTLIRYVVAGGMVVVGIP